MLDDEDHEQDDLHNRTQRDLDENAKDFGELPSEFLACETNEVGRRDHGDIAEYEDEEMVIRESKVLQVLSAAAFNHTLLYSTETYHSDRNRHNRPQYVDDHRQVAARPTADFDELYRVDEFATTFPLIFNALGFLMP